MKVLLFLLLIPSVLFAGPKKYWVFFDAKSDVVSISDLEQRFSARAIEKRLLLNKSFDWYDLPVSEKYLTAIRETGAEITVISRWLNACSISADENLLKKIRDIPGVTHVEPVMTFTRQLPDESLLPPVMEKVQFAQSTGIDYGFGTNQIQVTGLHRFHNLGITGMGIRVGVQDAGIRWRDHESLDSIRFIAEYDFVEKDSDVTGDDSHGTAVLSLMAAYDPGNLVGGTFGSEFVLSKTEYSPTETMIEEDNWVAGIEWLESLGVDIMNSSVGYLDFTDGPGYSFSRGEMDGKTAKSTIAADIAAKEKGLAVFVSIGNEGNSPTGSLITPADGFYVFSSGAVTSLGSIASFSSSGPTNDGRIKPDGMSMGQGNFIANHNKNRYSQGSGTSYASPLSASAGALILSVYPELTPLELNDILRSTAKNASNPNSKQGWGIIQPLIALFSVGPAVSNTFSVTQAGDDYVFSGKIAWNRVINTSALFLNFYQGDLLVHSASVSLLDSLFTATLPGSFAGTDTLTFSLTGTGTDAQLGEKSFTWPLKPGFRRYWVPGSNETTANTLRRSGKAYNNINALPERPDQLVVSEAYPNPFNPATTLRVSSRLLQPFTLTVFNMAGQQVGLLKGLLQPGDNLITWNSGSEPFSSGMYLLRVSTNNQTHTRKVIFQK